jgi:hypothetical protein
MGYSNNNGYFPYDFGASNIGYVGIWHDNRLYDRK